MEYSKAAAANMHENSTALIWNIVISLWDLVGLDTQNESIFLMVSRMMNEGKIDIWSYQGDESEYSNPESLRHDSIIPLSWCAVIDELTIHFETKTWPFGEYLWCHAGRCKL